MTENAQSFIDSTFRLEPIGELELYRVDELGLDEDKYVYFSLSYYRAYTTDKGFRSQGGVKQRYLKDHNYTTYSKIDRRRFMEMFLLIEVITISILCLRFSNNAEKYQELHAVFSRLSLHERLQVCKTFWPTDFPKSSGDLLQLRNQVAHTLEERKLKYGNEYKWVNDEFNDLLKFDFNKVFRYILNILNSLDSKVAEVQMSITREEAL